MINRIGMGALLVFWLAGTAAAAESSRTADPVVLSGGQLDRLIGRDPGRIGVFAFDGAFRPALFQIDERMVVSAYNSWTTRVEVLTYVFDRGEDLQPDPKPEFDRNDEVVFMAASAGGQAPAGMLPAGSDVCEEAAISDPESGARSYIYICALAGPAPAAGTPLVSERGPTVISAAGYEVEYPTERNAVNFIRFQPRGPAGLLPDVVDRMKMQVQVNMFWGVAGFTLQEREYEHYLRGVRAGPVRVIKEFETVLESWAHAQIRTYNHVYYYPYHIEYETHVRGTDNWGKTINASALVLALDLAEPGRGMKFYSEKNLRGEIVDGKPVTSEIEMDYGPTEWVGVSGEAGTILLHLGFNLDNDLYKDLYYVDNDAKTDPLEDDPGMIGKFGFIVRNMQKEGRWKWPFRYTASGDPLENQRGPKDEIAGFFRRPQEGFGKWPVRFAVFGSPEQYAPGLEDEFLAQYQHPLLVKVGVVNAPAQVPDAPPVTDTREDQPRSIFAEQKELNQLTRMLIPGFIYDPNLLGIGPGIGYSDSDFLRTGTYFGISAFFSDRGYASYGLELSELRFIRGVEAFKIRVNVDSFPAQPYYGQGNDADKDNKTLYWWRKQEAILSFKKYFGNIYGADFYVGYRQMSIDSGIQPTSGEGLDSIEEHYGRNRDLAGERWGPPVYGMQGGNHNGVTVTLFRDMRNAKNLPKFGNYQELKFEGVSSAFGADYDYLRATLDLRAYWHPDFMNPLPFLDQTLNPRRTFATKFFGPDKNRALAGRIVFIHLIADDTTYQGREILDVPFYELTKVGSSSTIKGYQSSRFIDNDALFGSLEYRWRWWKFTDAAVFVDAGMVMDNLFEPDDWDDQIRMGYGFSTRIHVPPNITITFEFAWSEEEAAIQHQMNYAF